MDKVSDWDVATLIPLSLMAPEPTLKVHLLSPPSNRRGARRSPQVGRLGFQEDAVGFVIQDHVADIAAVEAGARGADAAGQEGVHG